MKTKEFQDRVKMQVSATEYNAIEKDLTTMEIMIEKAAKAMAYEYANKRVQDMFLELVENNKNSNI